MILRNCLSLWSHDFFSNGKHDCRFEPDTKTAIFCAGLRGLNATRAKQVVEWALVNEENLFISSIGCTENHDIHRDFLLGNTKKNLTIPDVRTALYCITVGSEENFNFLVDFLLEIKESMKNLYVWFSFLSRYIESRSCQNHLNV